MKAPSELEKLVDRVLVESLSPGLKAAIDAALIRGVPKATVLSWVAQKIGGPFAPRGALTYEACAAYLATK